MQGLGFLAAVIVGGLAGWIASSLMKADTGLFTNILLGIAGALVANWLLRIIGISAAPTWLAQGVVGLLGACILIAVWRMVRGR